MANHHRIIFTALGIGLLLAVLVILFIPEYLPGGSDFFTEKEAGTEDTILNDTNTDLLKAVEEDIISIDQEYNFDDAPTEETLASPTLSIDAEIAE